MTAPNTIIDVKQIFEDDDRVALYSHVMHDSETPGYAVVHIFRFKGDKIVEMWDVGQEISKDAPNEHGPF